LYLDPNVANNTGEIPAKESQQKKTRKISQKASIVQSPLSDFFFSYQRNEFSSLNETEYHCVFSQRLHFLEGTSAI